MATRDDVRAVADAARDLLSSGRLAHEAVRRFDADLIRFLGALAAWGRPADPPPEAPARPADRR